MKDIYRPITRKDAKQLMIELMCLEDGGTKRPKEYWKRHEAIMDYLNMLLCRE